MKGKEGRKREGDRGLDIGLGGRWKGFVHFLIWVNIVGMVNCFINVFKIN